MDLSVLDQSLARRADQAPIALQETLQMARWCEQLGYKRFWVSEHHAFPSVAGSAPEVLLAAIGAATEGIRIGSGGIMLPHYSPYKIAEVFSLLANLYPGRIGAVRGVVGYVGQPLTHRVTNVGRTLFRLIAVANRGPGDADAASAAPGEEVGQPNAWFRYSRVTLAPGAKDDVAFPGFV